MRQFTAVTKILDRRNRSITRLEERNLNLKKKLAKEREDTFRQFKNRIEDQQKGPRNNLGRNIIAGVASGGAGIGLINRFRNRGRGRVTRSFSQSGRRFNIFRQKPRLTSSRGVNTRFLRNGSRLNSLLTVAFTGYDIIDRKSQGQSNLQATTGALATSGGAIGGGAAGAKLGALIGTFIVPGAGTIIGGTLGGILGSFIGASAGANIADSITGADEQKRRQLQINKFRLQQGSTIFSKSLDTFDSVLDKFERLRADDFDPSLIERDDDDDIVVMLDRLSGDDGGDDDPTTPGPILPPFSNRVRLKPKPKIKWDWVITFALYAIEILTSGVAPTESLPITKINTKTIKVDLSKVATPKLRKIYLEYRKGNLDEVELENGIIKIINEAFEQLKIKPNEAIKNEKLRNIFRLKKNNLQSKKDGFINFSKFADTVERIPSLTRAQDQLRRMAEGFKRNFPRGFKLDKSNLNKKGLRVRGLDKIVDDDTVKISQESIQRLIDAVEKQGKLDELEFLNFLRKQGIAEKNIQKYINSEQFTEDLLRLNPQGTLDAIEEALLNREFIGDSKSIEQTITAFEDFLAQASARGDLPDISEDEISDLLMFLNRMRTDSTLLREPDLPKFKNLGIDPKKINEQFKQFLETIKKIKADQNLSMNEDGGSSNIAMVNVDGDKNINVINQEGARSFVNMGMGNKINMMQMQGYFTV